MTSKKKTSHSKKGVKKTVAPPKKKYKNEGKPRFRDIKPVLAMSLKVLSLAILVGAAIYFSDQKGYFNPDMKNNHTQRKWDSFYEFTKKNNVDILLLGNSHLYTGINPKNLSCALGANAFILASPGTYMADTYYSLKEALKQTTPAVVVLETYGIKEFDPHTMSGGSLSDQLKSYSARKNIIVKLESTPFLFTSDNYLSAWSNTIRNHDFLYTNKEQLEKNAEIISDGDEEDEGKLYLGRYLRFKTGIEPETLKRYEEEGAPVKGEDYHLNEYAEKYVDKIVKLCESKNIDLIFLTLPMYYKHIEDYDVWKGRLGALLNKYDHPWIDMQEPYDTLNFSTHCFENTYNLNQHMSYMGSLIASYKLADFIREQGVKLPDHSKDRNWHTMFYAEEGYFKNYPPVETDKKNVLVAKDLNFGGLLIKELSMLEATSAKPMIQVKIDRSRIAQFDLHNTQLQLLVEFRSENQLNRGVLQLGYDMFHTPTAYAIYAQHLSKPVEILGVNNARLVVASPPVAQQDRK